MSRSMDSLQKSSGTLDANPPESWTMSGSGDAQRPRHRTKRRHRRNTSGRLEMPYDPALDDRSLLEELEQLERSGASASALQAADPEPEPYDDEDRKEDLMQHVAWASTRTNDSRLRA